MNICMNNNDSNHINSNNKTNNIIDIYLYMMKIEIKRQHNTWIMNNNHYQISNKLWDSHSVNLAIDLMVRMMMMHINIFYIVVVGVVFLHKEHTAADVNSSNNNNHNESDSSITQSDNLNSKGSNCSSISNSNCRNSLSLVS